MDAVFGEDSRDIHDVVLVGVTEHQQVDLATWNELADGIEAPFPAKATIIYERLAAWDAADDAKSVADIHDAHGHQPRWQGCGCLRHFGPQDKRKPGKGLTVPCHLAIEVMARSIAASISLLSINIPNAGTKLIAAPTNNR